MNIDGWRQEWFKLTEKMWPRLRYCKGYTVKIKLQVYNYHYKRSEHEMKQRYKLTLPTQGGRDTADTTNTQNPRAADVYTSLLYMVGMGNYIFKYFSLYWFLRNEQPQVSEHKTVRHSNSLRYNFDFNTLFTYICMMRILLLCLYLLLKLWALI